ncbi:MAG: hypothetical protein A3F46_08055 [Legionellales bacterium RIFCSPHIGHO2_12_FULL_42_9]|nr:MAG: hypothetical protein A3F46_08055 [Legionellales bacterium RIFCSPHIGHO2_12_FULL_42_9]
MRWRQYFINHCWWGKLLGGIFGYMLGKSVGALFGVLIGNFFDRGIILHILRPHRAYHSEKRKQVQELFFRITFAAIGYVAKSDGRVSEQEIAAAQQIMDEMRLSRKQKEQARNYFIDGKKGSYDLQEGLNNLLNFSRGKPELLNLFMDTQYRAAMKGGFSESKQHALNFICIQLGFAPLQQQHAYSSRYSADFEHTTNTQNRHQQFQYGDMELDQAYAILEIPSHSNKQEVKRAYRRLISRNHPDKMIAKGLPESMIKLANNKTQSITKAYEQIVKNRGW